MAQSTAYGRPVTRTKTTGVPDREHGLDQVALNARQLKVVSVAALADGSTSEHSGMVAHDEDGNVRVGRGGEGRTEAGSVVVIHATAGHHGDGSGAELIPDRIQHRRHFDAGFTAGVMWQHVVDERVTAE